MFEEDNKKSDQQPVEQEVWDDGNLVNAFDLLLRIDMRINPDLYKPNSNN